MASAESRNVVKSYELQHNALLAALRPGGSLASIEAKGPCEALLVPRQVSLEAIHILPYIQAKLQREEVVCQYSPAPPLSDLFEEGNSAPKRDEKSPQKGDKEAAAQTDTSPSPSGLYYATESAGAFRTALTTFLEYHLLHFDVFGSSEFTTLRGQRGAFSEDLDHVKRYGHIGQVAVLADADPLQPSPPPPSSAESSKHMSPTTEKTRKPAELQIFFIDRPLMDSEEARDVVDTLRKLTVHEATIAHVAARPSALFSDLTSSLATVTTHPQQPARMPVDLPFLMSTSNTAARSTTSATASGAALLSPSPSQGLLVSSSGLPQSGAVHPDASGSDNESATETVIIDDFEDDITEEPDLALYVSKYTQISEQQRRRREMRRASEEERDVAAVMSAVVAGRSDAPATDNAKLYPSNAAAVPFDSPPLPGAVDPNYGREGTVAQVTAHVVGAPPASPASASVTASRVGSVEGNPVSSRGRVVSVTLAASTPKGGKVSASTPTHANVLRHEYSRECIKDYRRVVAADNDIHYPVFEQMMTLRCFAPLAKLMSSYVAKNQQLQQPIVSNVKYNKFIASCHTLTRQAPRMAEDQRQLTIVYEGVERYVTSRLYHQLYGVCEDEKQQNAMLQSKFMRLENMTAKKLDALPEVERHHVWGQAMFELDGMDFFKSPREKLRCGMRSCELLSLAVGDVLRQRRNAKNPKGATAATGSSSSPSGGALLAFGADEFLPCFLLLVLRARPLHYVQNICYIEKFRYTGLMTPEESYCFATLQSAMMFWLNCSDDGCMGSTAPAPVSSSSPLPPSHGAAMTTAVKSGGSVSVGALVNLSAGAAVPRLPANAAPPMTEHDLLPSLRQASFSARTHGAAAGGGGGASTQDSCSSPSGSTVVAQEESPTILDVLFGWANRGLAPIADEIGFGSVPRRTETGPSGIVLPTAASAAPSEAPPQDTAVRATSIASLHHVGHEVTVSTFPSGSLPTPSPVHRPDANTRALARELLVTQHKTFEQLTLTEIQMIVEEARQLLAE
jgi:hypothetical protein